MITTAATPHNIQLIVETIIASHMGMAFTLNVRSRHAAALRFQSIDQFWVCMCKALSLSVFECAFAKHYHWVYCTR